MNKAEAKLLKTVAIEESSVFPASALQGIMEDEQIPLSSISKLTGFPVDFIKKELVLENDTLPMKDLRKSMLHFLNITMDGLKK